MKSIAVSSCILLAGFAGQALAASCPPTVLDDGQIQALLVGRYACGTDGSQKWNELHQGGATGVVLDYKRGPGDRVDPSDTPANPTGTYTIQGGSSGTIKYTYGANSYTYSIGGKFTGTPPLGVYNFCNVSDGSVRHISVNAGPACTPPP